MTVCLLVSSEFLQSVVVPFVGMRFDDNPGYLRKSCRTPSKTACVSCSSRAYHSGRECKEGLPGKQATNQCTVGRATRVTRLNVWLSSSSASAFPRADRAAREHEMGVTNQRLIRRATRVTRLLITCSRPHCLCLHYLEPMGPHESTRWESLTT